MPVMLYAASLRGTMTYTSGDRVEVTMFGSTWLGTVIKQVPSGDVVVKPDGFEEFGERFDPPIGQFEQEHVRLVTGCAATDLG